MNSLTRVDPRIDPFNDLLDDVFKGFFVRPVGLSRNADTPLSIRMDVKETDQAYDIRADIPGVQRDDIKVTVDGDVVTIRAETSRAEEKKEDGKVIYSERSRGAVSRAFRLDHEIDTDKTEAKYENGVLALTLAKKSSSQAKQLQIL